MTPQEVLSPTFDPGLLDANRLLPNLPFEAYQKLPGVNSSLLKNPTAYEMLAYAVGMASLDEQERKLAELSGDACTEVLKRVEMSTPRTIPVKLVSPARNVLETDKLTEAQKAVFDAISETPMDSRDFKGATLLALDSKGIIRYSDEERQEVQLSESVRESRSMALAIGDATHKAILEPHMFDDGTWQKHWQLSPTKGLTSKAAQAAMVSDPRPLLTPEIIDTARRCRDAVYRSDMASELLNRPGESELTAQTWDEQAGCWRKARFDRIPTDPAGGIVDIKTTHLGLLDWQMSATCRKFGYGSQAAYYLDALEQIEGKRRDHFHIIFVTKTAPFMCRCREINTAPPEESFVEQGRDAYLDRLAVFALAWLEQVWEGYEHEGLTILKAPPSKF